MRAQWLVGAVLVLGTSAAGEPLPEGLGGGDPAQVIGIVDGETARLSDGSELRLAAILTPQATPPRAGQSTRPDPELERLQAAARNALAALIEGQSVTLYFDGPRRDRHGRQVAHLAGPTTPWVQAALVSHGLARVQTTPDNKAGFAALLRLEAVARDAGRGLWRHDAFRVRAPHELGRWIDTFQIVEGTTIAIEGARPAGRLALESNNVRLALNVSARARSELRADGRDIGALGGLALRVRGWVRWQNGPVIDVTHAAQIEAPLRRLARPRDAPERCRPPPGRPRPGVRRSRSHHQSSGRAGRDRWRPRCRRSRARRSDTPRRVS